MTTFYKGHSLAWWAKERGVSGSLVQRNYRNGKRGEDMFVLKKAGGVAKKYSYYGELITVRELAKRDGISESWANTLITRYQQRSLTEIVSYDPTDISNDEEAWADLTEEQIRIMREFQEKFDGKEEAEGQEGSGDYERHSESSNGQVPG